MPTLLEAGCHAFSVFHLLPIPRPLAGQGFLGWKHAPVYGFFWQKTDSVPCWGLAPAKKQKGPGGAPGPICTPGPGPGHSHP